jgi:hypothetical protein
VVLLAACAGAEPLDPGLLVLPAGGREEPAPVGRLERVERRACYAGRAVADVARELQASLAAAGWTEVTLAPGDRVMVTAARDGVGLTGVVEETAGCGGALARVGAHAVPPGAGRRTAGPGIRARISP